MVETLIVVVLLALLAGAGWAALLLPWQIIVVTGAICAAIGLLFGVPTGVYYHVRLHAELAPRGVLPARWWWSPVRYHRHLRGDERDRVMPWFYAGAIGFGLIVLGCGITLFGVLLAK
jgi:hypothetical protein